MKALIVVHEILRYKDDRGTRYLTLHQNLLNMSSYHQVVAPEGTRPFWFCNNTKSSWPILPLFCSLLCDLLQG